MTNSSSSEVVDLILQVGAVPSFSYSENRLHPLIQDLVSEIPGARITPVAHHNLVITVPGAQNGRPVALSAHLDKIDHDNSGSEPLSVFVRGDKIVGPMDDSAGLGLCLAIARASAHFQFPPLMLLFSEQEECGGAGARRISQHLLEHGPLPTEVITLDTTPLFRGSPGIALYAAPWERSGHAASPELRNRTATLRDAILDLAPREMVVRNNHNDYVTYGEALNPPDGEPVPSIALEPSIHPYHRENEEVFIEDILLLEDLLRTFLSARARENAVPPGL